MTTAPKIEIQVSHVMRAFEQGDVVILETERVLNVEQVEAIKAEVRGVGLECVVLPMGVRLASREEQTESEAREVVPG